MRRSPRFSSLVDRALRKNQSRGKPKKVRNLDNRFVQLIRQSLRKELDARDNKWYRKYPWTLIEGFVLGILASLTANNFDAIIEFFKSICI